MMALVISVLLVPVIDQTLKWFVRTRVAGRSLSLGVLGQVRVVESEIWTLRVFPGVSLRVMWGMWAAAAVAAALTCSMVPGLGLPFGLLVGGALSHALETSLRGSICDFVCLRFWPAFNLADVALTVGAVGLSIELFAAVA